MKSLKRISLCLLLLLAATGCVSKSLVTDYDSDTLRLIEEANRVVCEYKGKVVVRYVYKEQDLRFKGYLDKQCSNDLTITLLGPLGITLARVEYKDGKISAMDGTGDISLLAQYISKQKGLETMVELIRYPYVNVDRSYKLEVKNGEYVMTKDDVVVTAGADYLIKSIKTPEGTYNYKYSGGKAEQLEYVTPKQSIYIGLQ
ncbi:hypothetical protein [Seleniivibrio woodruffii]|uniref:DUF4292 domain-containing protein n=1 Tax=Seleniivibrio woodruffii TaxID=1078050 RepID=A0A4R1KDE2_9BACT|nr:hypothetical protein [Seleniivibrio woodruffii]TCK62080.1 hypothetical protein C8D98_0590 [Seleniivibrio woodruffii]TVZ34803.1 hypothetical protein OF66_0402 [Seleniivibrio woodruffii]